MRLKALRVVPLWGGQVLTLFSFFIFVDNHGLRGQGSTGDRQAVSIATLDARRQELQERLTFLRRQGVPENSAQIRTVEEDLLTVTGQEEIQRSQGPKMSKGFLWKDHHFEIPVFFITDRAKALDGTYIATQRNAGLEFGKALAHVGTDNEVRTDFIADARPLPEKSPILAPTTTAIAGFSSLLKELSSRKDGGVGRPRRVLLFVHGYNSSFGDAVTSAALLSTEVQFPVIPMVYSWPSAGTFRGYFKDEAQEHTSEVRFTEFLKALLGQSPMEVVIVSHSMGSRLVASALFDLRKESANLSALHHVVFAASDMFTQDLSERWPKMSVGGVSFTFYCSNHDLALKLSHIVHQDPRVGDVSPSIFAPVGAYTIDASAVDSMLRAFGHSYMIDSFTVGADIGQWVDTNAPPEARGLLKATTKVSDYYFFR